MEVSLIRVRARKSKSIELY